MNEEVRLGLRAHILDRILRPMDNLALLYSTSNTMAHGEVNVYFFKVIKVDKLHFVYNDEIPVIPANGTLDYGSITKYKFNSGVVADDYLMIPDEFPFLIYHYAIGIKPEDIRIYKRCNGTEQQVMFPNLGITVVAKYDFIDGHLSPYDSPRVIAQDIVTQKMKMSYGFANPTDVDIRPSLNFLGAAYAVAPIKDKDIINKILTGKIPCRYEPVFGLKPFTFKRPEEWPEPVVVNMNKIMEVMK